MDLLVRAPVEALDKTTADGEGAENRRQKLELWRVLNELGIRPFTPESVARYKREIERKANKRSILVWDAILRFVDTFRVVILGVLMFLSAGVLLHTSVAAGIYLVIASVVWFVSSLVLDGRIAKYKGSWRAVRFGQYRAIVPSSAQQDAVAIAERLNGVEYVVHEFVQQDTVLDPFLVLVWAGEEHFISVWDERGYDEEQEL